MKRIVRADPEAVSPVIAEILLVAITVVLVSVVYIMATGLLSGPATGQKPLVSFSPLQTFTGGNYNASFTIAAASQSYSPNYYRFNLEVGGIVGTAMALPTSGVPASITISGTTYQVIWIDTGGEASLNGGDTIKVTGQGISLPRATHFVFFLLWTDGSAVQQQSWTTP
ncbi:MAG TPA: type IV pilin N-terminal domain-containing protein [Thermoplasmata archaeon]|nr:type IV pilin N-terminal domain-containing protein [Thermoplasmata archaeon]